MSSACRGRQVRAKMRGMKSSCTSSISATGPAISSRYCRALTNICVDRRPRARRLKRYRPGATINLQLQIQVPKLRDHVLAPRVAWFARGEGEARLLVDMPGCRQNAVGPECDFFIFRMAGKTNALADQSCA